MFFFLDFFAFQKKKIDSPFDLERCGPAVDLALELVNHVFLKVHKIQLRKVQQG